MGTWARLETVASWEYAVQLNESSSAGDPHSIQQTATAGVGSCRGFYPTRASKVVGQAA